MNANSTPTKQAKSNPGNGHLALDPKALEAAKRSLDDGAVTPHFGPWREDIIKLLNDSLATELVCVMRYKRHHFTAVGLASPAIADEQVRKAAAARALQAARALPAGGWSGRLAEEGAVDLVGAPANPAEAFLRAVRRQVRARNAEAEEAGRHHPPPLTRRASTRPRRPTQIFQRRQHIPHDKAIQWEPFQEMAHSDCHGVDVPGRARDGLGQHASVSVVDTGREVTRFPRHRSKCGAQQGLGLLFDH